MQAKNENIFCVYENDCRLVLYELKQEKQPKLFLFLLTHDSRAADTILIP